MDNSINKAISLAIEKGGYLETDKVQYLTGGIIYVRGLDDEHREVEETLEWEKIVLDPLFWQSLGKAKNQDPYEMYTTFMEAHWLGNDEEFWTELSLDSGEKL